MKKDILKKIAIGMVGLMTVAALGTGAAALAMGIKNNGWFEKKDEQAEGSEANGGMFITQDGTENGVRFAMKTLSKAEYAANGVSEQAISAETITATVTPASAEKELTWTVKWRNAESAWAKGKTVTDYVELTPTDNGAIVSCMNMFGEQVIITATAKNNPEAYGTCTVNCAKRLTGLEYLFNSTKIMICDDEKDGNGDVALLLYEYTSTNPNWRDASDTGELQTYFFGVGTVEATVISTKVEVKVSDKFLSLYNAAEYYSESGACAYADWYTVTDEKGLSFASLIDNMSKPFAENAEWCNADDYSGLIAGLSTYSGTDFSIRLTAKVKYGEKTVDETKTYNCTFSRTGAVFKANSVHLTPEEITA